MLDRLGHRAMPLHGQASPRKLGAPEPESEGDAMQFEMQYGPAYAVGQVAMGAGEAIQAVTGAMVSMGDGITIETGMKGGVMSGLKRSILGGESFFVNTFTASHEARLVLAPPLPGDVFTIELQGTLMLHSGSLLAATTDISFDPKWGGAKTFFSGEGLFLLRCTGSGTILASSYGAIEERTLAAGESYTVDSSHVVGFEETVQYEVKKSGGWKTTILGGEGLVVRLTGPGRIYWQTRSPHEFLDWLIPQLPKPDSSSSSWKS
jgi:uncharacterized protein (TIGR00266 family)